MANEKDFEEIKKRSEEFVRIFNANDAKSLSELYTEDSEILAPGLPRLSGKKSVEKFWHKAFSEGARRFEKIDPILLQGDGIFAFEYANWLLSVIDKSGNRQEQTGKNLLIWQKVSGIWLIKLDMWNNP